MRLLHFWPDLFLILQIMFLFFQTTSASGKLKWTIYEWTGSICCPSLTDCAQNCPYDFEFCVGLPLEGKCSFSRLNVRLPHTIPEKTGMRIGSMNTFEVHSAVDYLQTNTSEIIYIMGKVAGTETKVVFRELVRDIKVGQKLHIDVFPPYTAVDYRLSFSIEMTCDVGFHGEECESYCKPPDDGEHYQCSDEGKKCLAGWTGKNCEEPICSKGCKHGDCISPDFCLCETGWQGFQCNECVVSDGCVNGRCNGKPFTCDCKENWGGENCHKVADMCRSRPCQNGGNCSSESRFDHYKCSCTNDFTGKNCEVEKSDFDRGTILHPDGSLTENRYFWYTAMVAIFVAGLVLIIWLVLKRQTGIGSDLRVGRRPKDIESDSLDDSSKRISMAAFPPPPYEDNRLISLDGELIKCPPNYTDSMQRSMSQPRIAPSKIIIDDRTASGKAG